MTTTPTHRSREEDDDSPGTGEKSETLVKGESLFSLFFTLVFVCISAITLTLGITGHEPMTIIAGGLFAVASAICLGAAQVAEAIRLCRR